MKTHFGQSPKCVSAEANAGAAGVKRSGRSQNAGFAEANAGTVGVKRSGRSQAVQWIYPGDWLIVLAGLALVAGLFLRAPAVADRVTIRQSGQPFLETGLRIDRLIAVPGPLGTTQVEIHGGRVRIKADPSPRQLCVKQGWLQAGEAAVCLPNRVSVELGRAAYDSLNY